MRATQASAASAGVVYLVGPADPLACAEEEAS